MVQVQHPSSLAVPGPALIDSGSLANLDEVMSLCISEMRARRDSLVDSKARAFAERASGPSGVSGTELEEARARIARGYPFGRDERTISVTLRDGRVVKDESFRALSSAPHIQDQQPKRISARIEVADAAVQIDYAPAWYQENALSVNVSSDDQSFSLDIFGRLQNWAGDIRPGLFAKLWRKAFPIPLFLLVLTAALGPTLVASRSTHVITYDPVRQRAMQIAREGVNAANQQEAIRLLLAIEVGYEPASPRVETHLPGLRFWVWFASWCGALLALCRVPRSAVGLWGGKKALRRERAWIRVVCYTVPGFIGTSIILPWVLRLLGLAS